MVEIFRAVAQNGRSGLAVVGPAGTVFPAQGNLRHIGRVAGLATYEFLAGETGTWVVTAEDVTVHGGATLVADADLQGNSSASLLLLGPIAVVEHHGYKRRGSRLYAYRDGTEADVPSSVLAAMGLVQASGEVIPVAPPPALSGAMAAAFGRLA